MYIVVLQLYINWAVFSVNQSFKEFNFIPTYTCSTWEQPNNNIKFIFWSYRRHTKVYLISKIHCLFWWSLRRTCTLVVSVVDSKMPETYMHSAGSYILAWWQQQFRALSTKITWYLGLDILLPCGCQTASCWLLTDIWKGEGHIKFYDSNLLGEKW